MQAADSGWCHLTLGQGIDSVLLPATNLLDCFTDLVDCVADLCAGRVLSSLFWPAEPGGWIIDLSQLGYRRCAVDVYAAAERDWVTGDDWRPRRGDLVASVAGPRVAVLTTLLGAMREAVTASDARTGPGELSPAWGWPLPVGELLRAERVLRSSGYRPR